MIYLFKYLFSIAAKAAENLDSFFPRSKERGYSIL